MGNQSINRFVKMKRRMLGKNGMATVEMSLLLPTIVLFVAGLVIFLLFLLDMAAAKGEVILEANEAAAAWKTEGNFATGEYDSKQLLERDILLLVKSGRDDLEDAARIRLARRIKGRVLTVHQGESRAAARRDWIAIETAMDYQWPLKGIARNMGSRRLKFSCAAKAPPDDWEEWLRMID